MADPINNSALNPGFFRSVFDGAVMGDLSDNRSAAKTVSQLGVGMIPVVGQVADVRDTYAAMQDIRQGKSGGWANLAFSALGWVPLAGDFLKSARKIGVRGTLSGIGESLRSAGETWRNLALWKDTKSGIEKGGFYKPSIDTTAEDLDGALGVTNRFGDIQILDSLDNAEKKLTLDHEKVHGFLSPKFLPFQEFRANLRLLGYSESHLLRRVEEGMAESWAQFQREGFSGIKKGWSFPYDSSFYNIDPERVKVERDIIIGAGTNALAAGVALSSIDQNQEGKD